MLLDVIPPKQTRELYRPRQSLRTEVPDPDPQQHIRAVLTRIGDSCREDLIGLGNERLPLTVQRLEFTAQFPISEYATRR